MDNLGPINLFTSHFVIGCPISDNKNINPIDDLLKWLDFKDKDWAMKKFRTERTQYISFLHLIDLRILEQVILDLIFIYKEKYPYTKKNDFIEYVFGYSIYDLERIISREYTWMASPPAVGNYEFYNFYDLNSMEFLDFAIPSSSNIEHYKQYYKRVIEIINNIDFQSTSKVITNTNKKSKNVRAQLFEVNKKNYIKLSEEYNFDEYEGEFIYRSYWPIIVVNNLKIGEFSKGLLLQKRLFIEKNGVFDLAIFKRENLDFLQNELNQYYDNLKRGKTKIWDYRKGDYFHVFNLEGDTPKAQTLLIINKDATQLEIYFKGLLSEINNFLEAEKVDALNLPGENTVKKMQEAKNEAVFSQKDDIENVINILRPLKGYWNRERILKDEDFERLKVYAISIVETNKLPKSTTKFPETGTTIEFIRKTFHLVYKNLSKSNKNEWIDLVHLFKQLKNTTRSTTFSKFSQYNGDYQSDIKNCISY